MDVVPLLWLYGPPGVGKTSVAWEVFRSLSASGVRAAVLDTDQIGLCLPTPALAGDHGVKARNLAGMWPNYAGVADCLIVCGMLDSAETARAYASLLPGADVTLCRLTAGEDELRKRFLGRGWLPHLVDAAVEVPAELDRTGFADVLVGTDGRSVPEVARLVREPVTVPRRHLMSTVDPVPEPGSVSVLWVTGPRGVGKSSVGWDVFARAAGAGTTVAYVDLDQIGFVRPESTHRLKAHNLAALWRTFYAEGAEYLVLVGAVDDPESLERYVRAIPGGRFTVCRLRAGMAELTERILARGRGEGPPIPGDDLAGAPEDELRYLARETSLADEKVTVPADLVADTDGRTVEEIATPLYERLSAGALPSTRRNR
ncbi:hypothetical protein [Amycolatopsis minnesotensis]|uniref:AAA domain-containing protein n=1 Tax=Amycolatopsis minnesotensis TaxID=337894 RepID=A0ABN2S1R9_9PSEU